MASETFRNFIGGKWVPSRSGRMAPLRDPGDRSSLLGEFPRSDRHDTEAAIDAACSAQAQWGATSPALRAAILNRVAELLTNEADALARMLTREEGKVLSEAKGEVLRAAAETRFMAGEVFRTSGAAYPSERPGGEVVRRRVPLGPVGVITPWNFPVVSPVRKISPALAYGDTVVFKPATLTPWTAIRLTELYEAAGVPPGVLNTVCGSGSEVGDVIVGSPQIRGITFTGSTSVGRTLAASAAKTITRVQLEMGGKNAAVVFDAEDLGVAAAEIVSAAYASSGQRCTAISRVIVSAREHDELLSLISDRVRAIRVGYGLDDGISMGPLVSQEQVETTERYVEQARKAGARVVEGGTRAEPGRSGFYYAPTVIDEVRPGTELALEEVFGPVLAVLRVSTFEEAIRVCNETQYGLASCVFTASLKNARRFAAAAESGMVHINHGTASQPHVPFGGVKESGFGPFSIGPTAQDFYLTDKIVYFPGE